RAAVPNMVGRTWTMTADGLRDLNAPAKTKDKSDDDGAAKRDTSHAKVAAVVWRGPSRKAAPKSVTPTRVTSTPAPRVEFPNVFALLGLKSE
ncbi:MAG TPA: hypothetical protein PK760_15235, partial [Flavobacteriales bacterium]|nr:hypothetical protein [Flavobacteriales bacterium]